MKLPMASGLPPVTYLEEAHKDLPHVLQFSGGKSSGMMLFKAAESGLLKPERGDVVLFQNTSAEHPETYVFAAKCKELVEKQHGIPFFWTEYCTAENKARGAPGHYSRMSTFRLVNPGEHKEDGSVFEEMVSKTQVLPNFFNRFCTSNMKVITPHRFMRHWLSGADAIPAMGREESVCDIDSELEVHRARGGKKSREELKNWLSFALSQPHIRPEQAFQDFTKAELSERPKRKNKYAVIVGFRADELKRRERFLKNSSDCFITPLIDWGIDTSSVNAFWEEHYIDFRVPENMGNCVFCFMKGKRKLRALAEKSSLHDCATPQDFGWWARLEGKYGGDRHNFLTGGERMADVLDAPLDDSDAEEEFVCACTD